MRRSVGTTIALIVVACLVVAAALGWFTGAGPFRDPQGCTAQVQGHTVTLSPEQAENASLIAAIAVGRGLPPRAASIALATAYQESGLINLDYGDRDSLGLFQQRPSQGWGARSEILDPGYATHRFYDALVKVEGYQQLEITVAAQRVQRSAFPNAYADHEQDARALASALTGQSPGGRFTCVVRSDAAEATDRLNGDGLVPRAALVRRELTAVFGNLALGGFAPGGVTNGHMAGSAHYDGRALDVFVRPVSEANRQRGWAIAAYLVAQADRLKLSNVIFDDRIWSNGVRSEQGWRDYRVPSSSSGDRAVLEHRDHVHVDVFD